MKLNSFIELIILSSKMLELKTKYFIETQKNRFHLILKKTLTLIFLTILASIITAGGIITFLWGVYILLKNYVSQTEAIFAISLIMLAIASVCALFIYKKTKEIKEIL